MLQQGRKETLLPARFHIRDRRLRERGPLSWPGYRLSLRFGFPFVQDPLRYFPVASLKALVNVDAVLGAPTAIMRPPTRLGWDKPVWHGRISSLIATKAASSKSRRFPALYQQGSIFLRWHWSQRRLTCSRSATSTIVMRRSFTAHRVLR